MRHITLLAALSIGLLALAGCYETAISLGPTEQATVEKPYLGVWSFNWNDGDATKGATATVLNLDGHQYFVEWAEVTPDGKREVERYRAILVNVQGATFAQLTPITQESSDKHLIMRAELRNGKLRLRNLEEKFFNEVTTTEQLKQKLSQGVDDEQMYQGDWAQSTMNSTTRP